MRYDAETLGLLGPERKAVPVAAWGRTAAAFVAGKPGLADLPTPVVTLDDGAVTDNLAAMAAWARAAGVDLAPHGKTTMAPTLWRAQLDAGAWAVTVATPWQLGVALTERVPRILAAYAVLDLGVLGLLSRPRTSRVLVWADGVDVVEAMAPHVADAAQPIDVLIDLGAPGGRTGARSVEEAVAVARAVVRTPGVRLAGVAGYEGSLAHDASPDSLERVRTYLAQLATLHTALRDLYDGEAIVTAGGSAYFDLVADALAPLHDPPATRVVVRAGAYLAHDDGFYRGISPANRDAGPRFRSALHGWVRVISRPEPGLALADGGKRDLPFDEGLPEVQAVRRGATGATEPLDGAEVTALADQHTFLRLSGDAESLAVGDVVRLGLSHPCTTFDKWSLLPVLDDAHRDQPVVVDVVRTVFG
ncbi:alanine racemase [Cryptosporangium aurantiacum]|uniref:D-serine deaminase, pyridoxal phosphate-dependent n=1 Tax=Cryptosporangium aurantiacum TaxID=134849 RepID=A0A1M7TVF9_9ACTN|nr:alanine racemase [Cryptosporangium aurantiacum]SHN74685.1 D-serine deaminase, pyridoxal phosphate-dependent [Cryptosporangium aurantiacum]